MFTTPLTQLITLKALKQAYAQVSKTTVGLDQVTVELFEEDLVKNLEEIVTEVHKGRYVPEPLSRIYVPKEQTTELRAIGLGALKDKVVQKTLAMELGSHFEKYFSDKSYGYRVGKGTLKAIGRVKDYVQKGSVYIYRLDIENFFETISHEKLLALLQQHIADAALLHLVALFLKNGSFQRYRYIEHIEGIHQGDPLSPLLANIYLNQLDWFLENNGVDFVRFADDMVLLFHTPKALTHTISEVRKYLTTLSLTENVTKSYEAHAIKEGFDFLGIHFEGWHTSIDKAKLDAIITKQNNIVKSTHPFSHMAERLHEHFVGLQRYYFKLLEETSPQFELLQNALLLSLSKRIAIERKRGLITTKKLFKEILSTIEFGFTYQKTKQKDFIERMVNRGLEAYLAQKKYKKPQKAIGKKRKSYATKYATSSVLYVSEAGSFIGVAKQTITVKQKRRVVYKMPKNLCERIIVASSSVSLSAALVKLCAEMGIAIDFIDMFGKTTTPYASLYGTKNAYARMTLKQLNILQTPLQLKLAKSFIKGKVKNQINYLKYLNKYHNTIDKQIEAMEKQLNYMLLAATTPNELMGYEGQSAVNYWHALGMIVDDKVDFTHRITYKATDIVNTSLNYGYAILYSRVQYHAVRAGLSLHISFLHALNDAKPTLVFDLIEEFRAFVVDRVIFTMFNQQEPLKLDKEGLLDTQSRQRITKKVLEKIGSTTKHKRANKKVDTIIAEQTYMLARAIKGLTTYKPFIGKY
jgi:group II intron reverse transcriptase/maturase/CRISPR-associated endonuclease Cas1